MQLNRIQNSPFLCQFTFILIFSFVAFPAIGATIAMIGSEELVNNAELIFEGEVVSVSAEMNQNGKIYTYVEFSVEDILVGDQSIGSTLTLRFTGGTVNGVQLDVGAKIPAKNERGIYFVERVEPGLINPLLGWTQGHFTIGDDDTVVASNGRAVQSIERISNKGTVEFSHGVALGIITTSEATGTNARLRYSLVDSQTLSVEEFKRIINEIKD